MILNQNMEAARFDALIQYLHTQSIFLTGIGWIDSFSCEAKFAKKTEQMFPEGGLGKAQTSLDVLLCCLLSQKFDDDCSIYIFF